MTSNHASPHRYRSRIAFIVAVGLMSVRGTMSAEEPSPAIGLEERVPWTTSRIKGSPEPPPPFRVERVYPQLHFDQPVAMVATPDGRETFLVERQGRIYRLPKDEGEKAAEIVFDGKKDINGLHAVYGLAFPDDFAESRVCYICYILKPELEDGTRVSRFKCTNATPTRIDTTSEEILLTWKSGGHNGGCLKFGPDGYLYISTGDGAAPSPPDGHDTGQDISDLLASILRIDVSRKTDTLPYAIPTDNPFVKLEGARPEVWAYGLRNPWRMSFDRATGELWVGDVGWQLWEMVYRIQRGGNYGWSVKEGPQIVRPGLPRGPTTILPPVVAHPRAEAASVTGGYVYRGKRLPKLRGKYVYGDYVTGKIWALDAEASENAEFEEIATTPSAIIAFHETHDGELVFMDYNLGTIHRLVENNLNEQPSEFPRRLSETGLFASTKKHTPAAGVIPFSINAPQWMDGATAERWVAVPNKETMVLNRPIKRVPVGWGNFPAGTVLMKTISVESEPGDEATKRRLETQILHLPGGQSWRGNSGEWRGYSYIWNEDQTDAELAPAEGATISYRIAGDTAGTASGSWNVPGRSQCYNCHNPWTGYRLAFTTAQLHRPHDYAGKAADQLATLKHIGLISLGKNETEQQSTPLTDPGDKAATLDARARSYLHVNCAHCHRFGGGGTATIDLRHSASLADLKAIHARPTQGTFEIRNAEIIAPGDPHRSVLYYRLAKLGAGHMPHIGSTEVDPHGSKLIANWINKLAHHDEYVPVDPTLGIEKRRISLAKLLDKALHSKEYKASNAAVEELLASTDGALSLLHAIEGDELPLTLKRHVITLGSNSNNALVQGLFERFVPRQHRAKRLGTSVDVAAVLELRGNADRGKALFFESKALQCNSCHRVGDLGGQVGPDLTDVGNRLSKAKLAASILNPSQEIAPKFTTYFVETLDGKVITGLLLREGEDVIELVDAKSDKHRIPRDEIELFMPRQKSLMPELLYRDLSAQQLADLLEFLSEQKK